MKNYTIIGRDTGALYHHVLPELKKTGTDVVAMIATTDGWAIELGPSQEVPRRINWAVERVIEDAPMNFTMDDMANLLCPCLSQEKSNS